MYVGHVDSLPMHADDVRTWAYQLAESLAGLPVCFSESSVRGTGFGDPLDRLRISLSAEFEYDGDALRVDSNCSCVRRSPRSRVLSSFWIVDQCLSWPNETSESVVPLRNADSHDSTAAARSQSKTAGTVELRIAQPENIGHRPWPLRADMLAPQRRVSDPVCFVGRQCKIRRQERQEGLIRRIDDSAGRRWPRLWRSTWKADRHPLSTLRG